MPDFIKSSVEDFSVQLNNTATKAAQYATIINLSQPQQDERKKDVDYLCAASMDI